MTHRRPARLAALDQFVTEATINGRTITAGHPLKIKGMRGTFTFRYIRPNGEITVYGGPGGPGGQHAFRTVNDPTRITVKRSANR